MRPQAHFWMNITGVSAAQYPTDGAGGITATQGSSAFATSGKWAGKTARVVGYEIYARDSSAATVLIKDHAATATYKTIGVGTSTLSSNESDYKQLGLGGIVIPVGGLAVTPSHANVGITVYFDLETTP